MLKATLTLVAGALIAGSAALAQEGGLDFAGAPVAETFPGLSPRHTQEASLRPGRVAVETDPARVRSGQTSVRMQVQPGDCGARIGGGLPDDCANNAERIEIDAGRAGGTVLYGFSLMLAPDFRDTPRTAPTVNLVQWLQPGAGACLALYYSARNGNVHLRNRCGEGGEADDVSLGLFPFDRWHEFVVLATWSKGEDGLFRVMSGDRLVYSFAGPTLQPDGEDEVSQRFTLNRPNGLGRTTGPATMWIDDVTASAGTAEVTRLYQPDLAALGIQ